jgi:flagellar hook-length control protein FliK
VPVAVPDPAAGDPGAAQGSAAAGATAVPDPAAGAAPAPGGDALLGAVPLPEPAPGLPGIGDLAGMPGTAGVPARPGTDPVGGNALPAAAGPVPDPNAPGAPGALPRGLLDGLAPVPDPQAPVPAPAATPAPSLADLAAAGTAAAAGGSAGSGGGASGESGRDAGTSGGNAGTAPLSAAGVVTQTGAAAAAYRAEALEATGSATRSAEQHSPPVSDQVTRHVLAARSLGDGTRETVLHLTPDHLGPVTVTLQVQGSDVRLDLAANQAALAALNADLGDLRDGLSASGLSLTDVTMRPDDAGNAPQQQGRDPGQDGLGDGRQDGRPAPGGDGRATEGRPGRQIGGPGAATGDADGPERVDRPGLTPGRRRAPLDIRV